MTQRLRVLVVDDEPIVGKRLQRMLAKMGCDVDCFEDPRAALERLQQHEFDLVITDIKMDEIDGMKILAHAVRLYPEIKVVMITGYAMMELARRAMEMGAYDFVAKPFTPEEVREVVARAAGELGITLSQAEGDMEG